LFSLLGLIKLVLFGDFLSMEKPRLTMEYGSEYLLGNIFTRAIVISVLDKKYGQEEAVWNTNFSGSASIDIRVGFLSQFYKLLMDLYFL
jgi:hypothetical protein